MIMGNPLVDQVNVESLSGLEFKQLRGRIGELIGKKCTHKILAPAINRTSFTISRYENERLEIPSDTATLMRLLVYRLENEQALLAHDLAKETLTIAKKQDMPMWLLGRLHQIARLTDQRRNPPEYLDEPTETTGAVSPGSGGSDPSARNGEAVE